MYICISKPTNPLSLRYFIEFAYKGTNYHGWQYQPNAVTVQETLNTALSTLLKAEVDLVGAGRTDTGVHAKQMFAHFDVDTKIEVAPFIFKANSFLQKTLPSQMFTWFTMRHMPDLMQPNVPTIIIYTKTKMHLNAMILGTTIKI